MDRLDLETGLYQRSWTNRCNFLSNAPGAIIVLEKCVGIHDVRKGVPIHLPVQSLAVIHICTCPFVPELEQVDSSLCFSFDLSCAGKVIYTEILQSTLKRISLLRS